MPYPVLLAKTKLTANMQKVSQNQQQNFDFEIWILGFCHFNSPNTSFLHFPSVLLSFESLRVSTCHDSATMSQAPSWQEMPTSDTLWHMVVVFCGDFSKNEWCQLGLGDWLYCSNTVFSTVFFSNVFSNVFSPVFSTVSVLFQYWISTVAVLFQYCFNTVSVL